MITSMRVNELQTLLSMFKMPKLGKKQELIQRCIDLLRSPSIQVQVANQVKLMMGKGNRVGPYPVPVRGYVPNGAMMNGNAGGYGGYRGQMIPPMQNSLHQQCRPVRNLIPIDLPFYDSHQTLLEPMELPAVLSGVKSPCKQSFSFLVPREHFANWSQSAPLPRFEVQLRFFQLPIGYASQELADDFPLNCMVRLDEQVVQLPVRYRQSFRRISQMWNRSGHLVRLILRNSA
ncbi:SAP domain-containing protein [Trichostrongylus colubriformis]|uniref:SAP domain-containing protein n=1 Tax=Trichostrongylus colubriformis TaxID=6319 RepID=A0AAN8FLD3_TRICO